jgi:hypothetical protein
MDTVEFEALPLLAGQAPALSVCHGVPDPLLLGGLDGGEFGEHNDRLVRAA